MDSAPAGRRDRDDGRRMASLRRRRPSPGLPLADPPPRHPRTALPFAPQTLLLRPCFLLAAALTPSLRVLRRCPSWCWAQRPSSSSTSARSDACTRKSASVFPSHPLRFPRDLLAVLTAAMFWISAAGWRGPPSRTLSSRTPTRSRR